MGYAIGEAVPWPVPPDWANGVRENLAWLTEILAARNGEAQKRELRQAPRRDFSFDVIADEQSRRVADALLFDQGGKVWTLPVWHDIQLLTVPAGLGDDTIACRTDGFEFVASGRAMLWSEVNTFEVVRIDSVEADALTLLDPLARDWPAGSRLYPVLYARSLINSEESAWTDVSGARNISFTIDEPCDWPAILPATIYRGYPVLDHHSEEGKDPTASHDRVLQSVDAGTGPVTYFDYVDAPFRVASHRWLLGTRAEHAAFRSLLYGLRGRMAVLWVPTMSADLRLAADIASGSTALVVEWAGYTVFSREQSNRRDLRIELFGGTVLYRRINNSVESGDTETLTLDAAPGVAIAPGQVRLISFMTLSELAADSVEIDHITDADGITLSAVSFRAVKHEL